MRLRIFFALFSLSLVPATFAAARNVIEHGAVPDGKTLNTAALNRLVTETSASGGGTIEFPAGTYLTGTIYLKNGVVLQLDAGATILGSTELTDYPENVSPRPSDRLEWGRYALISAMDQHDIAIIGQGRINGQGDHPNFTKADLIARGWSSHDAYVKRPYGLSFVRCHGVTVEGVRLENLAMWCEHYFDCDEVVVRGVTVDSLKHDYNNDGIDIDSCRHVRVSDCHFNAGDDAICLKAQFGDCENIVVTNCTGTSLANGVKFGTASSGGFKNIAISNLTFDHIGAAGIALEIVDGGTMDGVALSNIAMRDVGTAIFIRLGNMARRWTTDTEKPGIGALRNLTIDNIVANVRGSGKRPLASSITGLSGHPVENISLSNLRIITQGAYTRGEGEVALSAVPDQEKSYPENGMFGPLPAYGFFVRHVSGLTLRNVDLRFAATDYRSALVCQDVEDLTIDGLAARSSADSKPVIVLADVHRATLVGAVARGETPVYLRVEGASSEVTLLGSNLRAARTAIELGDGVPTTAVFVGGNRE